MLKKIIAEYYNGGIARNTYVSNIYKDIYGCEQHFSVRHKIDITDKVFTEIIHPEWEYFQLTRYLGPIEFNKLIKKLTRYHDFVKRPLLKSYIFADRGGTNGTAAVEKFARLLDDNPVAGIIFEDIDPASEYFQFAADTDRKTLKRRMAKVGLSRIIREKLLDIWDFKTTEDDTCYYTIRRTNSKGEIVNPLNSKKGIFVSKKYKNQLVRLEYKSNVLSLYTLDGKFITKTEYNSESLNFVRENIIQKMHAPRLKAVQWFRSGDILRDDPRFDKLGIYELDNKWRLTIKLGATYAAICSEKDNILKIRLPEKYKNVLKNVTAKCTPVILRLPTEKGIVLRRGLRLTFGQDKTKKSLIYYMNGGKITAYRGLLFDISLQSQSNVIQLPFLKESLIVDTDKWDKIKIYLKEDCTIMKIEKKYDNSGLYELPLKKIYQLDSKIPSAILLTDAGNFTNRVCKHITGIMPLSVKILAESFTFYFGRNSENDNPMYLKFSAMSNPLINKLITGQVTNDDFLDILNGTSIPNDKIYTFLKEHKFIDEYGFVTNLVNTEDIELKKIFFGACKNYLLSYYLSKKTIKNISENLYLYLNQIKTNFDKEKLKFYGIFEKGNILAAIPVYDGNFHKPATYMGLRLPNRELIRTTNNIRHRELQGLSALYNVKYFIIDKMNIRMKKNVNNADNFFYINTEKFYYSLDRETIHMENK
ncbi:MAG: hypothetical protein PHV30_05670 [Candidatus Margulisbacteria bacterium]|nr:hypothetical protein [Candidatus Margulisiibacteriota bacterium]